MFFRKLTILWSVSLLVVALGCSAGRHNTLVTEPSQSELSAIADKYYQLFLTKKADDSSRLNFVVCPSELSLISTGLSAQKSLQQGCVPAFLDKNGRTVSFASSTVKNSSVLQDGGVENDLGYQYYLWNGHKRPDIMTASAALGGVIFLLVSLPRLAHPATAAKAFSPRMITTMVTLVGTGVGTEAVRMNSTAKAQRCVQALRLIKTSTEKLDSSGTQVSSADAAPNSPATGDQDYKQGALNTLEFVKDAIETECAGYKAKYWVDESVYVSLVDSFPDMVDTNPNYVRTVSTRIPNLLPLLGDFVTSLGWVEPDGINYQCLPRGSYSPFSGNKPVDPVCILLGQSWDTGNVFYNRAKGPKN
ncbi:MAG: hypothetical protein OXC44_00120 [Proteobacteria bacterium]|nr:hypothetical protein [Pseudomonadota bacterium]